MKFPSSAPSFHCGTPLRLWFGCWFGFAEVIRFLFGTSVLCFGPRRFFSSFWPCCHCSGDEVNEFPYLGCEWSRFCSEIQYWDITQIAVPLLKIQCFVFEVAINYNFRCLGELVVSSMRKTGKAFNSQKVYWEARSATVNWTSFHVILSIECFAEKTPSGPTTYCTLHDRCRSELKYSPIN